MPTIPLRRWIVVWSCLIGGVLAAGVALAQESAQEPDYAEQAAAVDESIRQLVAEAQRLTQRAEVAEGDYARILDRRAEQQGLAALEQAHRLAELVIAREAAGEDPAPWRERAVELLSNVHVGSRDYVASMMKDPSLAIAADGADLSAVDLAVLDMRRAELSERVLAVYDGVLRNLLLSRELDVDVAEQEAYLRRALPDGAENLSVALEAAQEQVGRYEAQLDVLPDDAELAAKLRVAEARVARFAEVLGRFVEMMDTLELETDLYKQQLFAVTGSVTTDIFDVDVMTGLARRWLGGLGSWLADNLPQFLFKVLLFLLVVWIASALSRLTRRLVAEALKRSKLKVSRLLNNMIIATAANLVLLLGVLFGLAQLGISVGPLLAGLGIAGFIVGFALQDTLGNFASGMMILLYRPYDVGDLIDAGGVFGKVSHMSLVNTTILTLDNQTLVMPNSKIWGDVIKNVTAQRVRRVDMVFGIGYGDDIPKAEAVLNEIVDGHGKVLDDPEPVVRLHTLNESSVDFIVRPWVRTEDYWDVYWDITRAVKLRFDEDGISIPFPQRDVHVYAGDAQPLAAVVPAPVAQAPAPAGARTSPDAPDAEGEDG